MTEERVIEILLEESNQDHLFPKLIPECTDVIAKNLSEVIYDTLKYKSVSVMNKRLNILRFIQNLSAFSENHHAVTQGNVSVFLKKIQDSYGKCSDPEVNEFLQQSYAELTELKTKNLCEEVLKFYSTKNKNQKRKNKQLDKINNFDKENLKKANIVCHNTQYTSIYETNENLVKRVLEEEKLFDKKVEGNLTQWKSPGYRKKQIQFGYALLNLDNTIVKTHIENILKNLKEYKTLLDVEIRYLKYLWEHIDKCKFISGTLLTDFPFLFENSILEIATDIVKFETKCEYHSYIDGLQNDINYATLKTLAEENVNLKKKFQSVLLELYCFSYCNENLLRFSETIFP